MSIKSSNKIDLCDCLIAETSKGRTLTGKQAGRHRQITLTHAQTKIDTHIHNDAHKHIHRQTNMKLTDTYIHTYIITHNMSISRIVNMHSYGLE